MNARLWSLFCAFALVVLLALGAAIACDQDDDDDDSGDDDEEEFEDFDETDDDDSGNLDDDTVGPPEDSGDRLPEGSCGCSGCEGCKSADDFDEAFALMEDFAALNVDFGADELGDYLDAGGADWLVSGAEAACFDDLANAAGACVVRAQDRLTHGVPAGRVADEIGLCADDAGDGFVGCLAAGESVCGDFALCDTACRDEALTDADEALCLNTCYDAFPACESLGELLEAAACAREVAYFVEIAGGGFDVLGLASDFAVCLR
ncbi:hypothetical protein K8I61_07120 [bacterium]|nr:hypothetical protein [bacterium]